MKLKHNFFSKILIKTLAITVLLTSSAAFAGQELCNILGQLENLNDRPTVETILTAFKEIGVDPFSEKFTEQLMSDCGAQYGRQAAQYSLMQAKLPKIIAQFELAFPGAIYSGMGRDSAFLVDLIDGFYLGRMGMANRAKHFRLSGNSFQGSTVAMIPDYIASLGFDWKSTPPPRGFILFDATSYSGGSQSTTSLRSLYDHAKNLWANSPDKSELLKKLPYILNLVSVSNRNNDNPIGQNAHAFLEASSAELVRSSLQVPSRIFTVDGDQLTYSTEWHGTFGALQRLSDGSVTHTISGARGNGVRREILLDTLSGLRLVGSQEFFDSVVQEAKNLGYDFVARLAAHTSYSIKLPEPLTEEEKQQLQERREKRRKEQVAKVFESLQSIQNQLGNAEKLERMAFHGADEKITANAAEYHKWLATLAANFRGIPAQSEMSLTNEEKLSLVSTFLSEISRAYGHAKITNRDLRRLIPELVKYIGPELAQPGATRQAVIEVFSTAIRKDKYIRSAFAAEMEDWERISVGAGNAAGRNFAQGLEQWNPGTFRAQEIRYFLLALAQKEQVEPKVRKTEPAEDKSTDNPCADAMGAA